MQVAQYFMEDSAKYGSTLSIIINPDLDVPVHVSFALRRGFPMALSLPYDHFQYSKFLEFGLAHYDRCFKMPRDEFIRLSKAEYLTKFTLEEVLEGRKILDGETD